MSFAMLYFYCFLFGTTILLSLSFLVYFSFFFQKKELEFAKSNTDRGVFQYYSLLVDQLEETKDQFESIVGELNFLAWEERSWKKLLTQDYSISEAKLEEEFDANMETNMKLYSNSVKRISVLKSDLTSLLPEFQNGMDYLDTREQIFASIPRGRPLRPGIGFVTSIFGYRGDPFGLVTLGEFHTGIDFAAGEGTPIYATAPGVVAEMGWSNFGLGKAIRINHENGFYTMYGHCSNVLVKAGDVVKKGDLIGQVGSTGKATGSHVHYEVRTGFDPALNPEEFINLE